MVYLTPQVFGSDKMLSKILEIIFRKNIELSYDIILKPYKLRSLRDGVNLFNLDISSDFYRGDHTPKFQVYLDIVNFRCISIEVYNSLHEDLQ